MITIEFIGPSAIGKSTFLADFKKHSRKRDKWTPFKAALIQAKSTRKRGLLRLIHKISPLKTPVASRRDVKTSLFTKYEDEIEVIAELFFKNINRRGFSATQKIKLTDYFFNAIVFNLLLVHHSGKSRDALVLEEGLVQNSLLFDTEISPPEKKRLCRSAVFPSAVVHFDLDDDAYRERVHRRFRENGENRLNPVLEIVDSDRMDEYLSQMKAWSQKNLDMCRHLDIPVLQLTARSSKSQFEELDGFVEAIHGS